MKLCKKVIDLVPLFVSDDVSPEERLLIQDHIQTCESCNKYLDEVQSIQSAISREKTEAPDGYGSELVVRLNREIDEKEVRRKILSRAIPAFSAFTVIILFVSVFLMTKINRQDELIAGLDDEELFNDATLTNSFSADLSDVLNISDSPEEYKTVVVRYVLEDSQELSIDRYVMASNTMDESEFETFIKDLKNISL